MRNEWQLTGTSRRFAAWLSAISPRTLRNGMLIAAIAIVVAAGLLSARRTSADSASLGAAYSLSRAISGQPSLPVADQGYSPGYVLIVTAVTLATPGSADGLACWAQAHDGCSAGQAPVVVGAQILAAAAVLPLAYRLALLLSGDWIIALLAAILFFFSIRLGEFAGLLRAHIWYLFVTLLHLVLLSEAGARRSVGMAGAAGTVLGLAVLLEPLSAVLVPVDALLLAYCRERGSIRAAFLVAAFGLGVALFATVTVGIASRYDLDLTSLATRLLPGASRRAAFIGLERSSWLAGLLTPIPWIGDMLLAVLPAGEGRRLAIGAAQGSLALEGLTSILPSAVTRGGTPAGALQVLLQDYVLRQPVAYLLSIPVVAMRGLFAGGGIVALVGIFDVRRMLRYAAAEGRLGRHLLALLPIAALFVANVLFGSNEFWINPMVPFIYAYAFAYVAGGW